MIRFAQADHVPSITIAAFRLSIASMLMTPAMIRQRSWKDYATLSNRQLLLIVLSGLLLGVHFATWVTSLEYTSVVSSVVLVTTTPLWVALVAPILIKERSNFLTWVGILVAFVGVVLISLSTVSKPSGDNTLLGNMLALLGAITVAGYIIIGRYVRAQLPLLSYLWLVYGTAAVALIVCTVISGDQLFGFSARAYILLVGLGVIPQLIGHSAANYAVRHLPASVVSTSTLGEPIGSAVLAVIFLGEWPDRTQLIGSALILIGILIGTVLFEMIRSNNKALDPAKL
jgi:drug/metabolite transporter (DMT)-like permease